MNSIEIIKTPIGDIRINIKNNELKSIYFDDFYNEKTVSMSHCAKYINEYFNGLMNDFEYELSLTGTDFQKLVWHEIMKIPYGETRTYQQIAILLNKPMAIRAVANACSKNVFAIVIPCHRVVGKGS